MPTDIRISSTSALNTSAYTYAWPVPERKPSASASNAPADSKRTKPSLTARTSKTPR